MYSNTSCRQSYLGWLCLVLSISLTAAQMYSQGAISSISLNSSFPSSVMLTFDDGPHEIITPLILDVLKAKSVKATFFLVGFKAQLHPEIVLRISQEGHEVANHGWDHPRLTSHPLHEVLTSFQNTSNVLQDITRQSPRLMRPPYGGTKPGINAALLKRLGLQAVLWDVDTNDWSRPPPEQILRTVESTKRGSIILCHDVMPGTLEVLSQLIDVVRGKGFDFITISRGIENKETD